VHWHNGSRSDIYFHPLYIHKTEVQPHEQRTKTTTLAKTTTTKYTSRANSITAEATAEAAPKYSIQEKRQ
jgi:hypothetical protein